MAIEELRECPSKWLADVRCPRGFQGFVHLEQVEVRFESFELLCDQMVKTQGHVECIHFPLYCWLEAYGF